MISSAHVPWYNEHEWYHVYESLFQSHNNIEQQQWAITRISFWEQRCSNTPISISATKLLIQASITDRTSSCSISQDQVQMLYGIAIVRFINTYVDAEQRKYYAESISNLGCKLGIPSELVECRHRITHNADLPSIELLRHHAKLSLEYIVTTYWEPQAEMIRQRYTYSKHSTQFLLGLMALYLDLERFTYSSSFFETQISVKHSNGIKTQSFSPLSVYQHLLKLRHLRSERRQLKRLANRLHTTEEELLGNKNFIEILQCLRDWEGGFKNLLMFSRDFLCDASYDETVLSFIKDWVLIRRHPQNKNNMFVVFFIFFILNFVSVNLTYKLVEALLKTILSPVSSSYEMEENINTTLDKTIPFKRKISDPTNEVKKQYYAAWEKIFIKQSSIKTTQVSHHDSMGSTQGAYIAWLECFLLKPTHEEPFFLEWIARTVCFQNPLPSIKTSHDFKDRVSNVVVECIYKTYHRVQSICVLCFPYLFLKSLNGNILVPCQRTEQNQLILLMKRLHETLPEEGLLQRLLHWFDPTPKTLSNSQVPEKDYKEFLSLVNSFSKSSLENHVINEKLHQLELDCHQKIKKGIIIKKSKDTLWTDPGTFFTEEPQSFSTRLTQCGLKYQCFPNSSVLHSLCEAESFLSQPLSQKNNTVRSNTVDENGLIKEKIKSKKFSCPYKRRRQNPTT